MDVFVARQPIFNTRKEIFAYELLFRGGLNNVFPDIDGDTASSKLLSNSFLGIGIDRLTGGRKAFINFTRDLLVKEVPTMFPREQIMVEVLEDVEPEEEVIRACRTIVRQGYELALDDFVYREGMAPLIELASIIKIDFRLTPLDRIQEMVDKLSGRGIKLLAEKIETHEEFDSAAKMGFTYFQGYFFSKPEIIQSRDIAPSRVRLLQIIGEASQEDVDFNRLENFIKTDVSLSYKLLRYINSVFFRRNREIDSIKHAIVMLGVRETRKFISLIAAAELAGSKPNELIRTAIARAKLCELIGRRSQYSGEESELFLLGLFSVMDAILDADMVQVVENLPLSNRLKSALTDNIGELACFLNVVRSYENGTWGECVQAAENHCLNIEHVSEDYLEAVGWADAFVQE